jgi:hypothetical protein
LDPLEEDVLTELDPLEEDVLTELDPLKQQTSTSSLFVHAPLVQISALFMH